MDASATVAPFQGEEGRQERRRGGGRRRCTDGESSRKPKRDLAPWEQQDKRACQ